MLNNEDKIEIIYEDSDGYASKNDPLCIQTYSMESAVTSKVLPDEFVLDNEVVPGKIQVTTGSFTGTYDIRITVVT